MYLNYMGMQIRMQNQLRVELLWTIEEECEDKRKMEATNVDFIKMA